MTWRWALASALVLLAAAASPAQVPTTPPVPSDAEIRQLLVDRVDKNRQATGIVVGVVDASGRRIVSYGRRGANDPRPVDGDTVFEIGSMTKVFTALLLAEAVQRKELGLSDPVAQYLPSGVTVPQRGRAITLRDLSSHISGLPRLPANLAPKDPDNPYADYSVEQLYQFLSAYQLTRDVGAQYEYSNLGAGLLGHVLARRAQTDYETLVKARVLAPLGMTSTAITLTPAMRERLAIGHGATLAPAPLWDLPVLAGAGALRSSASDMLTFISAAMGLTPSPLADAFAATASAPRVPVGGPMEIALGWHIFKGIVGQEVFWHNGGTGGFRTFMGYNPTTRVGVVVLANASTTLGMDDIGRHLLLPMLAVVPADSPILKPPSVRTAISMDPAGFDRYVGTYQLAPGVMLTFTRDGARFMVQLTGQSAYEIFPEAERQFFLKVVDAQVTFEVDGQGRVTSVVLHQNGVDQRAPRVP